MTDWIVPSNPATFDVDGAFLRREEIDWSEAANAHIQAGDRVFLYQVAPVSAITHVCEVIRSGVTSADTLDDRHFWTDPEAHAVRQDRTWMRLRGIRAFGVRERAAVTLDALRESGMEGTPQGRRRAPATVSALVDQISLMHEEGAHDLVAEEYELLRTLGHPRRPWRYSQGGRDGTSSFYSFDTALDVPGAATALALLRTFLRSTELQPGGPWAVSALPSWAGPTDQHRFATINGNRIELFYVWMDSDTGEVASWGVRLAAQYGDTLSIVDGTEFDEAENGDVSIHGETVEQLLHLLDDSEVLEAVRTNAAERATRRRVNWHNPYLAALLAPAAEEKPDGPETSDEPGIEDLEFERRYIERVTRARQHQAPLRRAALRHYSPQASHYCGLDVVAVLDAAHIEADSSGGAASVENIRLLCANHHRAFDRGLLIWDGESERFEPRPGSAIVLPAPSI